MPAGSRLVVKFEYETPIELSEFSESLMSLIRLYSRFDTKQKNLKSKFFITDIRKGSIIFDIIIDNYELMFSVAYFIANLFRIYDFFQSKGEINKNEIRKKKKDIQDFSKMTKVIMGDDNSINISTGDGSIVNAFNVNSSEAREINRRNDEFMDAIKEDELEDRDFFKLKSQEFRWLQAKMGKSNIKVDKGIIKSYSSLAVPVIFANEKMKEKMLSERIFYKPYRVDVVIEHIDNAPKLYQIIKVYPRQIEDLL